MFLSCNKRNISKHWTDCVALPRSPFSSITPCLLPHSKGIPGRRLLHRAENEGAYQTWFYLGLAILPLAVISTVVVW